MQAKHSLEFARAPAVWSMYPKIMVSRKPSLVPDGGGGAAHRGAAGARWPSTANTSPPIRKSAAQRPAPTLPIAYPHVLAMPLHLAMLGAEAFPVKLFGLVHVQNRIAMRQPLSAEEPAEIRCLDRGSSRHRARPGIRPAHRIRGGRRSRCGTRPAPSSRASARRAGAGKTTSVARRRRRAGCAWPSSRAVFARRPGSDAATGSSPAT